MLFIFRKIRKSFFLPGKVRTYLAYAAGEIVLIMAGILLALQVSEWNQARNTQKKEVEILKSIKAELNSNLEDMNTTVIPIHVRAVESAGIIIEHFDKDLPYNDGLQTHFFNCSFGSVFRYTASAFETLKALGVDLISNEELRNDIIYMYDAEFTYLVRVQTIFEEFLIFRTNQIYPDRFDQALNFTSMIDGESTGIMAPLDYDALKNDTAFTYDIRTVRNQHQFYLDRLCYRIRGIMEDRIADIEQEIQRLEE